MLKLTPCACARLGMFPHVSAPQDTSTPIAVSPAERIQWPFVTRNEPGNSGSSAGWASQPEHVRVAEGNLTVSRHVAGSADGTQSMPLITAVGYECCTFCRWLSCETGWADAGAYRLSTSVAAMQASSCCSRVTAMQECPQLFTEADGRKGALRDGGSAPA